MNWEQAAQMLDAMHHRSRHVEGGVLPQSPERLLVTAAADCHSDAEARRVIERGEATGWRFALSPGAVRLMRPAGGSSAETYTVQNVFLRRTLVRLDEIGVVALW